ncbi:MAG TPA: hypothetical protein P5149_13820 [Candidatus Competibacteraceae bacterium]|nr:hypothetical protein [Candidatus Competibacteraceae bacterium]HPF60130.1 hypothetical protein [Candidatus Competibacteraceae bacterium]HRY19465.1 hypothetical protein [Candidatus Competibacteraceae bacterium]
MSSGKRALNRWGIPGFCLIFCLSGAYGEIPSSPEIEQASAEFKKSGAIESLMVLLIPLKRGMSILEVENLVGKPAYSPVDGQYYYATDAYKRIGEREIPLGLILDFRDDRNALTGKLESIFFGPIGE